MQEGRVCSPPRRPGEPRGCNFPSGPNDLAAHRERLKIRLPQGCVGLEANGIRYVVDANAFVTAMAARRKKRPVSLQSGADLVAELQYVLGDQAVWPKQMPRLSADDLASLMQVIETLDRWDREAARELEAAVHLNGEA